MNNYLYKISCCLLVILITSCKENSHRGVTDKIEERSADYKGIKLSSNKLLEGEDLMEITEGGHTFLIPKRKEHLKSFDCRECHSQPLKKMQSKRGGKKSHWNIKLNHADNHTMNCVTCHDGNNMNQLKTLTGQKVDFNKSYKLCAQCHSKQFSDWKGGAHGKKISAWAPPRASMTCVNCHNPHNPSFGTKWPARLNTQKIKERHQGIEHSNKH